jgi:hypothetical protein
MPSRHFALHAAVVRKAERQENKEENGLKINTFLKPTPRTPAVLGGLKRINEFTEGNSHGK